MVAEALTVVERGGFAREGRVLRNVVFYRSSDNWWNKHVGHQNAYAATNFPFAVVTLYPAFFRYPVDATERAAILLQLQLGAYTTVTVMMTGTGTLFRRVGVYSH
jgi:hypothetical protein